MPSPSFRQKATGGNSTAANVTVNVPAGTADNDVMLFVLSKDDTGAVTWPGGWNILQEATANSFYLGIGWRRASSEPASYTWNFSSIWRDAGIFSYQSVVTGENPNDPDTPAAAFEGGSVNPVTGWAPSNNTTTTAATVGVAFHTFINITSWSTEPSGWTARQNAGSNELHVMDQAFASAGAITGPTQTSGGGSGAAKAYLVALQSVSAGGGGTKAPPVFQSHVRRFWTARSRY